MSKSNKMSLWRILAICLTWAAFGCVIFSTPGYAESAPAQSRKPKYDTTHVYLLRGLLNVFSLGMDELGDKLRQRGFPATVHNHLMWSSLADDAVAEYKRGRTRSIVIMGHSAGAVAAVDMANRIGNAGVPVALVVAFDPAFKTAVASNNVRRVVNLYMPNGIGAKVSKPKGSNSTVENVDLSSASVHHMTLDKSNLIHERAIGYALTVVRAGTPPAAAKSPDASARAKTGVPEDAAQPQQ